MLALKYATKVVKAMLCLPGNNNIPFYLKKTTMANFGKKFLSAFVDITEDEKPVGSPEEDQQHSIIVPISKEPIETGNEKFRKYFEQLCKDANLPGPDYFEVSKMIEAMQGIPDEKSRYHAAFAGLTVQGLDKQKLLDTALQYIQLLETDAKNFNNTVDAALKEKVKGRQEEITNSSKRIDALTKEINELQQKISLSQQELKENEEKIESNSGAYQRASLQMKNKIQKDVEKIKQWI